MLLPDDSPWLYHVAHDPPRILVAVAAPAGRAAVASALRDTGYEVLAVGVDPLPEDASYDLVVAEVDLIPAGDVPVVLLPEPFDLGELEMTVLELLGWDGPATVRRGSGAWEEAQG